MKTGTETPNDACGWMAQLAQGRLCAEQRIALTDWLRESPTHVRELIDTVLASHDLAELPVSTEQLESWIDEARAAISAPALLMPRNGAASLDPVQPSPVEGVPLDRPHADIALLEVPREDLPHEDLPSRSGWGWRARYVLAAAVLVGSLLLGGFFIYSRLNLYTTGFGEERILTLADGSVVALNTDSEIRVAFSDRRRDIVLLKGEAFFRVAHDGSRPFSVSAAGATVNAVGTQFDVKIAPRDTVVSVVEGAVKVSLTPASRLLASPAGNLVANANSSQGSGELEQVMLTKGEEARVDRFGSVDRVPVVPITKVRKQTSFRAPAWMQGRLEFDAVVLSQVLIEFQRYRKFDFQIENEALGRMQLTGSFEVHDLESALEYIDTLPGVAVEKTGPNSYVIRAR